MKRRIMERRSCRFAAVFCAALILAAAAVFFCLHPAVPVPLACAFYHLTGFYCPGCGAGRACRAILQLRFAEAFCYNPLFVLILPVIGLYVVVRITDWAITGGNHTDKKISVRLLITILILTIIYGVIRNIPVYPFTLLAPGWLAAVLLN